MLARTDPGIDEAHGEIAPDSRINVSRVSGYAGIDPGHVPAGPVDGSGQALLELDLGNKAELIARFVGAPISFA